jgi:hypothetical protein
MKLAVYFGAFGMTLLKSFGFSHCPDHPRIAFMTPHTLFVASRALRKNTYLECNVAAARAVSLGSGIPIPTWLPAKAILISSEWRDWSLAEAKTNVGR